MKNSQSASSSIQRSAFSRMRLGRGVSTKWVMSGLLCALSTLMTPAFAASTISTLIGPDDMCGDQAFLVPYGVAVDKQKNVYASSSNAICKRTAEGVITRVAGAAERGVEGDGGPATEAKLSNPRQLAVDAAGNLYIADYGNARIRKIDAVTQQMSTVIGGGNERLDEGTLATDVMFGASYGIAVDSHGNLYVADLQGYWVLKMDAVSKRLTRIGGFHYPFFFCFALEAGQSPVDARTCDFKARDFAVDSHGTLYMTDERNYYIYKMARTNNPDGSGDMYAISILAGTGVTGEHDPDPHDGELATRVALAMPYGIAVDAQDNVIFSEAMSARIRKITVSSGLISTIAGDGTWGFSGDGGHPVNAQLFTPDGVAVGSNGDIYFADTSNHRIRVISQAALPLPPKVTGLKTVTGDGQVTVSWDAPTGASAASITGFTVTASPDGKTCEAKADETSCVVTGLSNSTGYVFSVVAHSSAGSGTAAETPAAVQPVASLSLPSNPTLPNAKAGTSYSASITPIGGTAPYNVRVTEGALPQGLSAAMSADGLSIVISGTPLKNETANFTLEISDSTVPVNKRIARIKAGPTLTTVTQEYTLTVEAKPEVVVQPPVLSTTAVPTLSQWALVLLSTLLAGFAVIRQRALKL